MLLLKSNLNKTFTKVKLYAGNIELVGSFGVASQGIKAVSASRSPL